MNLKFLLKAAPAAFFCNRLFFVLVNFFSKTSLIKLWYSGKSGKL
jgi:hypothetical protein